MANCFVCGEATNENNVLTVKKGGVKTLLSASILRGDEENERMLRTVDSVMMHPACYKSYANKRLAEARRRSHSASQSSSTSSPVEPQVLPTFDFKNYCFICAENVDLVAERKRPISRRRPVSVITSSEFRDMVLNNLNHRNDVLAREVIARIENVPDLTTVEARYHRACLDVIKRITVQDGRGRPVSNEVDRAMGCIYDYIEKNSDECQFTLKELEGTIVGDFIPDGRTIKKRLQQEYDDEILIFESRGADSIICIRDTGHKLFTRLVRGKEISSEGRKVESYSRSGCHYCRRHTLKTVQYEIVPPFR